MTILVTVRNAKEINGLKENCNKIMTDHRELGKPNASPFLARKRAS